MKKAFSRFMISTVSVSLIFALVLPTFAVDGDMSQSDAAISISDYAPNTRERYVASLALAHGISYAEADALEAASTAQITRGYDETVKYCTVDRRAGAIVGGGVNEPVNIATEVKYNYNLRTHSATDILSVGYPILYIPGAVSGSVSLNAGEPNIEHYPTRARISFTAAPSFRIHGNSYSIGGDIFGVTIDGQDTVITSRAKTYVMEFTVQSLP